MLVYFWLKPSNRLYVVPLRDHYPLPNRLTSDIEHPRSTIIC
jgi:hypothetical protein